MSLKPFAPCTENHMTKLCWFHGCFPPSDDKMHFKISYRKIKLLILFLYRLAGDVGQGSLPGVYGMTRLVSLLAETPSFQLM